MADVKLNDIPAQTTIAAADKIPFTANPGTTPVSKNITWAYLKTAILTAIGKVNAAVGFTLAGGTTSKTLTVTADTTIGGAFSKASQYSYDMASASGAQALTGAGFTPTGVMVTFYMAGASGVGVIKESCLVTVLNNAPYGANKNVFIHAEPTTGNIQSATLAYAADGGTLTWTKTGSPTGTLYFAIRWLR